MCLPRVPLICFFPVLAINRYSPTYTKYCMPIGLDYRIVRNSGKAFMVDNQSVSHLILHAHFIHKEFEVPVNIATYNYAPAFGKAIYVEMCISFHLTFHSPSAFLSNICLYSL